MLPSFIFSPPKDFQHTPPKKKPPQKLKTLLKVTDKEDGYSLVPLHFRMSQPC